MHECIHGREKGESNWTIRRYAAVTLPLHVPREHHVAWEKSQWSWAGDEAFVPFDDVPKEAAPRFHLDKSLEAHHPETEGPVHCRL